MGGKVSSEAVPSQWNVLHPLTLVPSAQRNETTLTSVARDQSSRRRALKAATSHKPNLYPYAACNPSALYSRGIVRIICPVVVVASIPPSEPQLAALQRFNSTCCQSHAQPAHLRYAVLRRSRPNDHHRALDARFHLDPPGSFKTFLSSSMGCDLRTAFTAAVWPSLAVETASPMSFLWCIAVSPKSSRPSVSLHRGVSSSDRSRCCGCQPPSMRIAQLARLPESRAISHPGAVLALNRYGCACQGSPCCP